MNKNKISFVLLLSTMTLFSCKSSKDANCDAYGNVKKQYTDTTIVWDDSRVSFIEVSSLNGLEIPNIPVNESKQLHMNDLNSGEYTIIFKSDTETLFKKVIKIN